MKKSTNLLAPALLSALLTTGVLSAADIEWSGSEDSEWSNAANWQAMPLPGHRFEELLYGAGSVGQGLCFDAAGVPEGVEKGDGDNWLPVDEREPGSDGVLRNEYAPTPRLHPATLPEFKRRPLPV